MTRILGIFWPVYYVTANFYIVLIDFFAVVKNSGITVLSRETVPVFESATSGDTQEPELFPNNLRVEIDSVEQGQIVLTVQRQKKRSYEHVKITENIPGDPNGKRELHITNREVNYSFIHRSWRGFF